MNEKLLMDLLDQYLIGTISAADKLKLKEMMEEPASMEKLDTVMRQSFLNDEFESEENPALRLAIQNYLNDKINEPGQQRPKVFRMTWVAAAASVTIIAVLALMFFLTNQGKSKKDDSAIVQTEKDINPGHEGAILTLANGQQIILDSSGNGAVAEEGAIKIIKKGAQVSYTGPGDNTIVYNTMTTPKGRTYSLVLADGTKVWLNAASSITFPTAFSGKDRTVNITGEAYFEVTKDESKPFHVIANSMNVRVLGTHFNVNSYGDGGITKATLLEGLVRVQSVIDPTKVMTIRPGEQAELEKNELNVIKNVDIQQVMAWKNGFFQFNGAEIQTVMKQIERWYDVTVSYEGNIPQREFAGQIPRNINLSEVLKILQESNVHFKIENKNLIVTP